MHLSTRRLDDRIPLSAAVRKPKTAKNRHVLRLLVTDFPESCGGTHVMHPLNTRSNVQRHNRIDKATTAPRSLISVAEMHHRTSKTLEFWGTLPRVNTRCPPAALPCGANRKTQRFFYLGKKTDSWHRFCFEHGINKVCELPSPDTQLFEHHRTESATLISRNLPCNLKPP
jgi:hypothetical protein